MTPSDHFQQIRSRRGSSTMEAVICFVFIIAGLVFMSHYFQRAAQGNLFGATQAVGQQFDPRDSFSETQQITLMEDTVTQQPVWGMFGADLRPAKPISDFMWEFYQTHHSHVTEQNKAWILESLPSGPVFREPAVQESKTDALWDVTRSATYNDVR